ncbi:MAG: peptidase [Actinomycetota bacterium]
MIRRAVLGAAAAAIALALFPTAASANSSPLPNHEAGGSFRVSETSPVVGAPFAVDVSGGQPGELVTLTITSKPASKSNGDKAVTSTRTVRAVTNPSGVANFTVALADAGVHTLTAAAADGDVVGTKTLTASAASAAADDQVSPAGFDGMPLALGGAALLALMAAGAVLVTRRRRSEQAPA